MPKDCDIITLGDSDDEDECEDNAFPDLNPSVVKVETFVTNFVSSLGAFNDDSMHTRGSVCEDFVQYVKLKMGSFKALPLKNCGKGVKRSRGTR